MTATTDSNDDEHTHTESVCAFLFVLVFGLVPYFPFDAWIVKMQGKNEHREENKRKKIRYRRHCSQANNFSIYTNIAQSIVQN